MKLEENQYIEDYILDWLERGHGSISNDVLKEMCLELREFRTADLERSGKKENPDFDLFWDRYPRKQDKKKAKTAFNNITKKKQKLAIDDCQVRYVNTPKQYIPMPTTYIHGDRWDDELILQTPMEQIVFPRAGDVEGWVRFASDHNQNTKPGESQLSFESRVKRAVFDKLT